MRNASRDQGPAQEAAAEFEASPQTPARRAVGYRVLCGRHAQVPTVTHVLLGTPGSKSTSSAVAVGRIVALSTINGPAAISAARLA